MPDPEECSRGELLALVGAQARELEGLQAENARLRERLDRLERLLSRNSGNSSMPPSMDDLPGRAPLAGSADYRRGRQA
jgi:transposase